jgi:hypothetical protein
LQIPGGKYQNGKKEIEMKTIATRTGSAEKTNVRVDDQVYKVGVAVIGLSSCAIGLWAVACVVAGMINSGGPINFLMNWVKAVSGSLF